MTPAVLVSCPSPPNPLVKRLSCWKHLLHYSKRFSLARMPGDHQCWRGSIWATPARATSVWFILAVLSAPLRYSSIHHAQVKPAKKKRISQAAVKLTSPSLFLQSNVRLRSQPITSTRAQRDMTQNHREDLLQINFIIKWENKAAAAYAQSRKDYDLHW